MTIETKELVISEELKKKVDMICKFAYVKPTYKNGNIRNIKGTNIAYVKPHIITINKIDYLMFAECDDIYKDYNDELRDENRKLHNLFKCNATNY